MKLPAAMTASLLLGAGPAAHAGVLSVPIDHVFDNISAELAELHLSGVGQLPLGLGPAPINDGYRFVQSEVLITEDATQTSSVGGSLSMAGSLEIDTETLALLSGTVTLMLDLDYQIYTVLSLTDIDPDNDYVAGLPDPILMDPAIGTLSETLTIDFTDLDSLIGSGAASPSFLSTKVSDLGVDVNGNGENDYLEIALTGLEADLDLSLGDVALIGVIDGTPQVSLSLSQLQLAGFVGDVSTDPPFGPILLTDPAAAPAPPAIALLGLGLAALWPRRRQV